MKCANMYHDVKKDCNEPVKYIDSKGFVYCADCGLRRKQSMRQCRKLTSKELKTLISGNPLTKY